MVSCLVFILVFELAFLFFFLVILFLLSYCYLVFLFLLDLLVSVSLWSCLLFQGWSLVLLPAVFLSSLLILISLQLSVYIHFCINYFTYLLFYFETNVCFWPAWVLSPASVFPWFEHCFHLCCYFHRCLVSLLFVTPWSVIDK